MSSRILVQLLLSLLLLVSQQLALGHGYAHLQRIGTEQVASDDDDDGQPRPLSADHLCGQCLTAHQLVFGLGGLPTYSFKAVAPSYPTFVSAATSPACLQVVCVFQPRAPPRA
ncbi:hypothetical protein IP92_02279 [Pseudoduganella flava]|uniref:DUF2946 domain-containing protein n=1 Tax=Pseudoduganella flava TaxID=871742 RepID=A0A562PXS2_9BURK|nr:hypothetical protein [Pseudoduganella flava]QGZ39950.1 hypothetical protein GO485_13395 [Pseudoduganella flava]TWI48886.1 hypothetical protein IP92_02279 [Pseudoduganella flava]